MGFTRAAEDRPTPAAVYNYRPYLLTFLSCLGSWMFGYNNGVIAGVLVLPSFYDDFHLPPVGSEAYNNTTSNIVSLFQIGGLVGSMLVFPIMKYWGRKVGMIILGLVYFLGAALQAFCYGKLAMMYCGRLIAGIGTGGVTVVVPLYIAELAPPSIRGSLVGIYEINNQLSSLMGYWCVYIVNEYVAPTATRQWQIPLAMQMVPSALLVVAAAFVLPESPRFLVKKGNKIQARRVLEYVRNLETGHEYINAEMEEIEDAIRRQEKPSPRSKPGRFGLVRELWWKGNRRRLVIGMGLMLGQNLTGINGINFYTPTIFRSIGFDGTKVVLLASGMYAAVKAVATILSLVFFIDRAGRRKLLLTSSIGASLALWYIGGFVTAAHIDLTKTQQKTIAGWIAIVCVYVFAAFFSFAWNGVVWIYCAEIFPTRIKELAVCLCTAVQWISQFAVARATPSMISNLKGGFFFFFAACLVVMGLLVYFLVPETKGRTLERMDEIFGTAYGDLHELELSAYRRDLELGPGGKDRKSEGISANARDQGILKVVDEGDLPHAQKIDG